MSMRRRRFSPTAGWWFILAALFTLLLSARRSMGEENRAKTAAFFDGPVRTLRLAVAPVQMEQLKRKPRAYVEATLTDGDQVYRHVAVKLKGGAGSFQPLDRKPGLTLNFHTFPGAKRYHGMKQFHLNNAAQDPTCLNELIAGAIARKAGVPAARCTHALVRLNERHLGLYVLKEAFNKDFLAEFYQDTSGDLYEPGASDISEKNAKKQGDPEDTRDLKALIAACGEADPGQRWEKLGTILDLDQFINYLALENIVVHWDSYSGNRNNYQFYKDPGTGRFSFFLDGMDQTLAFPDHALLQRQVNGMVSSAVLGTPQGRGLYLARVGSVLTQVLKPNDWVARVEAAGGKVREALAVEHPERVKDFEASVKLTQERVARRIRGVEKQLAALQAPASAGGGKD